MDDEKQPTNWGRVLTPIVGLIVLVVCIGVGFLLSDPAINFLRQQNISGLPTGDILKMVVTGGIGLILLLVCGMLYAFVAPKPERTVSEAQLEKEKKEKLAEELRMKKMKREMKNKMRQRNRE